jgi:hypothetical protein
MNIAKEPFSNHAYKLCLRSEDAFVITCVANLMKVKVFNRICGMKFLVTGVSVFNDFIPTSTEHEIHDYICIKYRYKPPFNKYCHIRESVVSRID